MNIENRELSQKLVDTIDFLKQSISKISVYDLNYYSMTELYYGIANKINELIETYHEFGVSISEEVVKQNECLQYLLNDGLIKEVVNKINQMVADGTMDTIINHNIFNDLNSQINEIMSQLEHFENEKINKENIIVSNINEINNLIVKAYEEKRDLYIPKKSTHYILKETIKLKDGVNIHSNNAIIEILGCFNIFECENISNVSINNLILDGRKDINNNTFFNGFYIKNSNNIDIKNCEIRNIKGYDCNDGGVNVVGNSSNVVIDNCYIHNCSGSGVVLLGEQVTNNKIINSKIINIDKSPIMIKTGSNNNYVGCNYVKNGGETNISINGKYNIIEGNTVYESVLLGINLGHNDINEVADYSIVKNNILYNCGIGGIKCEYVEIIDNKIYNAPTKGIGLADCTGCNIINNLIDGECENGGINLSCQTSAINNNCTILGNKLHEIKREGIRIYNTRYSNISNNIIENPCFSGIPSYNAYCSGIVLEGDNPLPSQSNIISNNIINDNREVKILKYGINTTSGRNSLNLVNGNIIHGCETGVYMPQSNGKNYINGVITDIV